MKKDRTKFYFYLWSAAALYVIVNLVTALDILNLGNKGSVGITLLLFGFVLFYGAERYGWRGLLIFFGITAVISWSMETLSIATGFPFGYYHYSSQLGPKLGSVPLIIMPAYFGNGFLAWTISHIFLKNLGPGMTKRNLFQVPTVAAFVMVMWDFCIDPVTSTISKDWIWKAGDNFYFGVPVQNYFGWFLTVFLIYQAFAGYLRQRERAAAGSGLGNPLPKSYWFLAPVMFIGTGIPGLVHPFVPALVKAHPEIYWSMFLATLMTMIFVSLLAIVLVMRFGPEGSLERDGPSNSANRS